MRSKVERKGKFHAHSAADEAKISLSYWETPQTVSWTVSSWRIIWGTLPIILTHRPSGLVGDPVPTSEMFQVLPEKRLLWQNLLRAKLGKQWVQAKHCGNKAMIILRRCPLTQASRGKTYFFIKYSNTAWRVWGSGKISECEFLGHRLHWGWDRGERVYATGQGCHIPAPRSRLDCSGTCVCGSCLVEPGQLAHTHTHVKANFCLTIPLWCGGKVNWSE